MPRKTRRTHTKSRNGCVECKHRHVKCDERRPACSNCISADQSCDFLVYDRLARASRSTSRDAAATSSDVSSPGQQLAIISHVPPVNMLHAQLLYHVLSGATMGTGESGAISGILATDILRFSSSAPYLMNQLLAYGALHLSVIRPHHRSFYRHHAAHLQAYALNNFNGQQHHINEESSVPIFLFAKLLGLTMLSDTLVFCEDTFEMFIRRFAHYIRLHQGMRTTSAEGGLEILRQTALHPLLEQENRFPTIEADLGPVCRTLFDRIQTSESDESKQKTYQTAIQALQSVMTALKSYGSESRAVNALSVWPIVVPREYVDLLSARKGEALVILAHYGALIHPHHDQWMFGDGGHFLIESVQAYLGPGWTDWLEWPLQILVETRK